MNVQYDFEQIYRENAPGIRKLCLSYCGNSDLAEDLLQETFITVWKNLENFRSESKISTWIYRIAVNTCLLSLNKTKKENFVSTEKLSNIQDEETDEQEKITILHKSISELKEADRIIITLVLEEKSYEEIAEITGITENNLRVKIHRIKKELTEIYQKNARL